VVSTPKTKTNKPLHKDLSFWIVAATLLVVANAVQYQYGFPWFIKKVADMKPAPRVEAGPAEEIRFAQVEAPLDMSKKTHSWQVPRSQPNLLETTPPQVVLIPTEYTPPSGGWTTSRPDKAMGIRVPASLVMQLAYSMPTRRMAWIDPAPAGQFDFIANLPSGGLKTLQDEIKKQWGLVAERQNLPTNVLVLNVQRTNAAGLKPADISPGAQTLEQGTLRLPMASLVSILEQSLRVPVVDQTSLTGVYEVAFNSLQQQMAGADRVEAIKKFITEQMGLGITESNMPIEMLVIRKATP
jgi:uncharacterized protein (TIGR03435 family)